MNVLFRYILGCCLIIFSSSCEAQEIDNLMNNRDMKEMVRLVNQARQKGVYCGGQWQKPVSKIKWDDKLEKAASDKSYDMYKNNYFEHTSPEGQTLADRLKTINYAWKTIGENLALGPVSVKQSVENWLKSDGHCRNIMKPNYTHLGAAQYGTYWTQVFATPRK
jgi:uncharacterized protein YkwD